MASFFVCIYAKFFPLPLLKLEHSEQGRSERADIEFEKATKLKNLHTGNSVLFHLFMHDREKFYKFSAHYLKGYQARLTIKYNSFSY